MRLTRILVAVFVWLLSIGIASSAAPKDDGQPALSCDVGPLQRKYGGTDWVVYSCSDGRTVVIHSAAGNPAMPFYFIFFRQDERMRLYGEGTGDKKASEAAYKELEAMSERDVAALVRETKAKSGTATSK